MLIVALTGGIATGKSVVASVLAELGCYIHRADQAAHQLMKPQSPVWSKIVDYFGPGILREDGEIDRQRLGEIIFTNAEKRAWLNQLIHPLVLEEKKKLIAQLEKEGRYKIYVSEAALTIEAGYHHFYDKIIVTYCPPEIQLTRLKKRDSIDTALAQKKIASQMPGQEKLRYADYIIDTSGSLQKTIEQTERVYRHLLQDYYLKQAELNSQRKK